MSPGATIMGCLKINVSVAVCAGGTCDVGRECDSLMCETWTLTRLKDHVAPTEVSGAPHRSRQQDGGVRDLRRCLEQLMWLQQVFGHQLGERVENIPGTRLHQRPGSVLVLAGTRGGVGVSRWVDWAVWAVWAGVKLLVGGHWEGEKPRTKAAVSFDLSLRCLLALSLTQSHVGVWKNRRVGLWTPKPAAQNLQEQLRLNLLECSRMQERV